MVLAYCYNIMFVDRFDLLFTTHVLENVLFTL